MPSSGVEVADVSPLLLLQGSEVTINLLRQAHRGRIAQVLSEPCALFLDRGVPPRAKNQRERWRPAGPHTVTARKHLPERIPLIWQRADAVVSLRVLDELIEHFIPCRLTDRA